MTFHCKKRKKQRKTLKNGMCNILKQILNNFETENQWPYIKYVGPMCLCKNKILTSVTSGILL